MSKLGYTLIDGICWGKMIKPSNLDIQFLNNTHIYNYVYITVFIESNHPFSYIILTYLPTILFLPFPKEAQSRLLNQNGASGKCKHMDVCGFNRGLTILGFSAHPKCFNQGFSSYSNDCHFEEMCEVQTVAPYPWARTSFVWWKTRISTDFCKYLGIWSQLLVSFQDLLMRQFPGKSLILAWRLA